MVEYTSKENLKRTGRAFAIVFVGILLFLTGCSASIREAEKKQEKQQYSVLLEKFYLSGKNLQVTECVVRGVNSNCIVSESFNITTEDDLVKYYNYIKKLKFHQYKPIFE